MEIVLAFVLFFGGFTLGSITADEGDDAANATLAQPHEDSVSGSPAVVQSMHQDDPTRCQTDRAVIYRDLTVPSPHPMGEPASQVNDGSGDGTDD